MPESTQIMFSFQELAEILVKHQGLHEGHWDVVVRFGISAANIALAGGNPLPTAIVPIIELGIQRENESTPLSVDATKVNPAPPGASTSPSAALPKRKLVRLKS